LAVVSTVQVGCAHGIVVDLDFSAGGSGGASTATGEVGGFGGLGIGGAGGSAQAGSSGRGGSPGSTGEGGATVVGAGGSGPVDASGTGGVADSGAVDVVEASPADAPPEGSHDAAPDVNCPVGGALSFDGVSSRVTIAGAALPLANKARTVEMWMKVKPAAPDWSPNHTVFEYGGDGTGAAFAADMDAFPMMELYVHPSTTSLFFSTGVTQEAWFHFAATYDGTTLRAFIGGVEKGTKAMSSALATTTTPFSLAGANAARKYFSGSIDELRIWSVARTGSEIQQTMSVRLKGNEAGLVGYWRFDETSGAIAHDATSSGHDAMLVGTALPAWGASGVPLGCP
jgi:hypothetical protein